MLNNGLRYTGGLTPEQDSSFLEELISKVSLAYAIFRGGGDTPLPAGPLVDLIVAEKLRVPDGFAEQAGLGAEAISAWARAVEGAKPYRNAMQLIADRFPDWWRAADGAGRAALAKHLPNLGPAVADLGDAGVADLLAAGEPALACAASYALADAAAMRAIASVARAGRNQPERCWAVLGELAANFPLSLIEESREAERFLPALGRTVEAAGAGWAEAVELAARLVKNDPSSAYGVLEAVPKALAGAGDKQAYLGQFSELVKAMGNRVAGVCLKRLPGARESAATVERAIALSARYGVQAGERYLEGAL